MTEKGQIYKCEICGNVVEVLDEGVGELVCCGQPMKLIEEKTEDEGKEKHVPIIEKNEEGVKVKVGSVPHPMTEEHYIEWIEISTEKGIQKNFSSREICLKQYSQLKQKIYRQEFIAIFIVFGEANEK
jgi:superoxide reductase